MTAAATLDPLLHHGGRIAVAAQRFASAAQPWLDLSTGISPWAYPIGELGAEIWHRLPDADALAALEASAAEAFGGVSPDQIVAVPGTDFAIRLLASCLEAERIAIVGPTYSAYHAAWPSARILPFEKARGADLLICANPNNPDGAVIVKQQLQRLRNLRIVDEAFADAMPKNSLLPHRNGAIVLRSFGKFFGLAGLRLGFVVADKPLAKKVRERLGDWPISGPALVIGTQAYRDTAWQQQQRERLTLWSARLVGLLANSGLGIMGGTPLFQLASHPDAASLFKHLAHAGILVRPFAEQPECLRFGIPGTDADFDRLAVALQNWRA